jgi:hypothetical protein
MEWLAAKWDFEMDVYPAFNSFKPTAIERSPVNNLNPEQTKGHSK